MTIQPRVDDFAYAPEWSRQPAHAIWAHEWAQLADRLRDTSDELRPAVETAITQGFVLTPSQARDYGISPAQLRRLARREWQPIRRGVLGVTRPHGAKEGAALAASAAALAAGRDGVISGSSAAVLHAIPNRFEPRAPVLTVPLVAADATSTRYSSKLRGLHAQLSPIDRTTWFGTPVTTIARTVTDLGRADRVAGVIAADAVLGAGRVSRRELSEAVERCRGWPGVQSARFAIDFADGLAESPSESVSRLVLADGGMPTPQLQVVIQGVGWWYRVDFLWPEARLVLEVDGLAKYGTPDVLRREKLRDVRLSRRDYRVEHLTWEDVTTHADATVRHLRRVYAERMRTSRPASLGL